VEWAKVIELLAINRLCDPESELVSINAGTARRPWMWCWARGLAVELAPVRVNCLSPGTTDSELWRNRPADMRNAVYEQWRSLCLVQRPATVEEQAQAALFLLDKTNMTGSTLYCDGGYVLR